MLVSLQHSLSDMKRKGLNGQYNQQLLKARAFRDTYNANIAEAEKEWKEKTEGP